MPVVEMQDVFKTFDTPGGRVHAVNGVSLSVEPGETLALIGESGSGKSTLGRLLLGLYKADSGSIKFDGRELTDLSEKELRSMRSQMTVVFQEPDESLNPRMTIGQNVAEPLRIHEPHLSAGERDRRVREALEACAIDPDLANRYPRQLSGGQQQRVGVARAIVTNPKFVVLDEPTSSLDLSVRSQIIKLLRELQDRLDLSYLFITHDIHTVHYVSDRIAVMYLGQIVEYGPTPEVFANPRHPYTMALLASTLPVDPNEKLPRLQISGEIPKPTDLPKGCLFYSRCPYRSDERCVTERPPLRLVGDEHYVATFYDVPAKA
jgi:oligopeptide/dipeptide ABC transporter ATP-binding protein